MRKKALCYLAEKLNAITMKKALFISLCVLLLAGTGCKKNVEPEPQKVAVTGVSLKPNTLSLKVGEAETLSAVVIPANADNKTVSWSTSDPSVATVANGLVTAVKEGSATITVTTIDGGKTATCAVTVSTDIVPVTGIKLNMETADLEEGKTLQLEAILEPANTTERNVSWKSSNTEVVTVSENGLVTGVSAGEATITAKISSFEASCKITVYELMVAVDLGLSVKWGSRNLGALTSQDAGNYYAWGETEPKDQFSWDNYKWYDGSSITKYNTTDHLSILLPEDDAASVTLGGEWRLPRESEFYELIKQCKWSSVEKGMIVEGPNGNEVFIPYTGYMEDSVQSTSRGYYWTSTNVDNSYGFFYGFENSNSFSQLCDKYFGFAIRPVYGEIPHPTAVKLNKTEATRYPGGILQLYATVTPANAANRNVTWSSSDESVATVDDYGYITVLAEGEAIITATTMDGGLTAQCKLTVNPIPDGAVFSADAFNSSTDEEPLLILQQDLSNSSVYIRKSSGTIDFNGHTVKYLYMQNNDPDKVVGLCNGIISQRLDGDYGWRIKGYHGKVMLEEMEVGEEFYTDGHVYIINSGYYESVDSYRNGSALGDVYIYGGHFKAFNHNPDTRDYQGDIYLFGGKFAMVPSSSYVNPTNPRANNRFIIAEGYSVKENPDEDKEEYPYIVSKD